MRNNIDNVKKIIDLEDLRYHTNITLSLLILFRILVMILIGFGDDQSVHKDSGQNYLALDSSMKSFQPGAKKQEAERLFVQIAQDLFSAVIFKEHKLVSLFGKCFSGLFESDSNACIGNEEDVPKMLDDWRRYQANQSVDATKIYETIVKVIEKIQGLKPANEKDLINYTDEKGNSALHYAVQFSPGKCSLNSSF